MELEDVAELDDGVERLVDGVERLVATGLAVPDDAAVGANDVQASAPRAPTTTTATTTDIRRSR